MHHTFPIHASAVLSKSGLNLFCAHSGTGKSTLAFNLYQRGYPLFSDDKCVLKWDPVLQKYLSEPSIRAVRLWQDAIDNMNNPNVLVEGQPVIAKQDKFQFNLDDNMYSKVQMVNKIFFIQKRKDLSEIEIKTLKRGEKIHVIKVNIHRTELISGEAMQTKYLKFIRNVARLVDICIIRRPVDIPVEEFVDFMQAQIGDPMY